MVKARDTKLDPLRTKTKILADPSTREALEDHGQELAHERDKLRLEGAERRAHRYLNAKRSASEE